MWGNPGGTAPDPATTPEHFKTSAVTSYGPKVLPTHPHCALGSSGPTLPVLPRPYPHTSCSLTKGPPRPQGAQHTSAWWLLGIPGVLPLARTVPFSGDTALTTLLLLGQRDTSPSRTKSPLPAGAAHGGQSSTEPRTDGQVRGLRPSAEVGAQGAQGAQRDLLCGHARSACDHCCLEPRSPNED